MIFEIYRKENGKDKKIRTEIRIGGKAVALQFTMAIWKRMEKEICMVDDLYTMMHSPERWNRENIPALTEMMTGGTITADEVMAEEDPATMKRLIEEIQSVIAKALTMSEKKYDDDSVHDETLEEIEKKEPRAD